MNLSGCYALEDCTAEIHLKPHDGCAAFAKWLDRNFLRQNCSEVGKTVRRVQTEFAPPSSRVSPCISQQPTPITKEAKRR